MNYSYWPSQVIFTQWKKGLTTTPNFPKIFKQEIL